MGPPLKRRRLLVSDDPDTELHERRVRNYTKLKSIFESIFEKYSKDFTDVGDVIDLEKGEIVVNNGHLMHMLDEKDPGEEDEWSDAPDEPWSRDDIAKGRQRRVIPDSQGFESSDDDPLGMSEDVLHSSVSSFPRWTGVSTSNGTTSHSQDGKRSMEQQDCTPSSSGGHHPLGAARRLYAPPRILPNSAIEEAWRVPPLPEDYNVQMALPSPSPSVLADSDSTRSPSPPGISVWAPVRSRRRSGASDARALPWTKDENELLRHYRTSTDLTFEDIGNHFPGRTPNSLQKRWRTLNQKEQSVIQNSQGRSWTPEEDQLLHRLKTSTDKTYAEIQRELPRHSVGAVTLHWYKMRQRLDQALAGIGTLSSDSSKLLSPSKPSMEDLPCQKNVSNQVSPLESSHAPVECHPKSTEAETAETLISLREFESDQSEPRSDDELAGQGRFPSDTVVPDSQGGEGTKHLLNHSLDTQACLRKPVSLQKFQDGDSVVKDTLLPPLDPDTASRAVKFKAYLKYRKRPRSTNIACSQKRKRITDKRDNYRRMLPKPCQSESPSFQQYSPKLSELYKSEVQQIPVTSTLPTSEAASPPERNRNDSCYPMAQWGDSATSSLHLEHSIPDSGTLGMVRNHELIVDRVEESSQDLNFTRVSPKSPGRAATLPVQHMRSSDNVIELSTSPHSRAYSTGIELQQPGLGSCAKTNGIDYVPTTCAPDELAMLETEDRHLEIAFQSSDSAPETRCKSSSTMKTAMDQCPSQAERSQSSSANEQRSSPESTDTPKVTENWQRPPAQIQSPQVATPLNAPSGTGTVESHAILPSKGDFPPLEHCQTDGLPSRSRRRAERFMMDVLGDTELQPADMCSKVPISSTCESREEIVTSPHKSFPVDEPMQSTCKASSLIDSQDGAVGTGHKGKVSIKADDTATKPSEAGALSAETNMPSRSHKQVDKPIREAVRKCPEAVATLCQRFYRVEIPKPSSVNSVLPRSELPSQKQVIEEHALYSSHLPTEDDVLAGKSQNCDQKRRLEHSEVPDVEQEEEHGFSDCQIHDPPANLDLLRLAIEQRAEEGIEGPCTSAQTSGRHPEDSISNADCHLTIQRSPLDVPSSNQKQTLVDEDDEDDLQLSFAPPITVSLRKAIQQTKNAKARRFTLRARTDDVDMSDDELATPCTVTENRIEMTPVRSFAANRQTWLSFLN
ncbi:MAG: hypothetical protein Q9225_005967 [Loekoesia sp. 1 TL-2023]